MLLGIQNAVLFRWKHIELWRQSTCKLKNGWDNGCQSYSFKDSCVISTWSNFSCGFRVLHETDAIFFFGWPKPCFSPVSPVSPFEFVYSLYTFSSPICRDFARALRKLCSFPLQWATGTRYLCVTKIFLLAVIITFKLTNGAPRRVGLLKLDLNRWTGGTHHSCYSEKKCSEAFASGQGLASNDSALQLRVFTFRAQWLNAPRLLLQGK